MLAGCGGKKQPATAPAADSVAVNEQGVSLTEQQLANAGIVVGTPSVEDVNGVITLQGTIDVPPANTVNLSFPMGGYVKSTTMLPGKTVRKGEVLALIEDIQFVQLQQDYLTAQTNYTLAEKEYDRQRILNSSKATSDKVYEQAKAEMDRQRILVTSLGRKLEIIGINPGRITPTDIRKDVALLSPINGFISQVNISIGKYLSPTDVLFTIVDPSDTHLALKVFERDLDLVTAGERVSAYANSNPEKRYGAKVLLVNRSLDENRMAEIHCHFDQFDPSLAPGMFMNGEVSVHGRKGLVVPEEAVVRWENKFYVFVATGKGQFTMTEVVPGIHQGTKQQIESKSVNQDTKLVLKNAFVLLMKNKNTEE
jgi:cobalt-zinc-cadmium efflux system membrane fusion protein